MRFFSSMWRFSAVVSLVVLVAGCPTSGPATVPVKGTLKINGEPAKNVSISLIPDDAKAPVATGRVENGEFKVFSGVQGTPGALPGKYKVVLAPNSGADASRYDAGATAGAKSSAAPKVEVTFPEKYLQASTSDKEVEITKGSNVLTIEIQ